MTAKKTPLTALCFIVFGILAFFTSQFVSAAEGVSPPLIAFKGKFVELSPTVAESVMNEYGVTNSADGRFFGTLTDTQAKALLKRFELGSMAKIYDTPDLTALNRRLAQMAVVDVNTVIKDGTWVNPVPPNELLINILPDVSVDRNIIHLTASPVNWLTNEWSLHTVSQRTTPLFNTNQITAKTDVWDGQTWVVVALFSGQNSTINDSPEKSIKTVKTSLLVFITPTLIDLAGNRIHSDEEVSAARNATPERK